MVFVLWGTVNLADNVLMIREASVHPQPNPHAELTEFLLTHQIRYARASYWDAYVVDFLSGERVIVGSWGPSRIPEYERRVDAHREAAVNIERMPCEGQCRSQTGASSFPSMDRDKGRAERPDCRDDARMDPAGRRDTRQRLRRAADRLQTARWKQWLDVQAPFRWNLRRLDPGFTLDIGCGIGRNLLHLPRQGVGVDTNEHCVRAATGARPDGVHAGRIPALDGIQPSGPLRYDPARPTSPNT